MADGRLMLIEEPHGVALGKVMANLEETATDPRFMVRTVRMLENLEGRNEGDNSPGDLLAGLEAWQAAHANDDLTLLSIDLIGHGSPGSINLGATIAGGPKVTSYGRPEWAQLDCDVAKLSSLAPFANRLRELRAEQDRGGKQWFHEFFELRLLGCGTAADPGQLAIDELTTVQDGAAFIHLLSSFFDLRVTGSLAYLTPGNFGKEGFHSPNPILRTCETSIDNGRVVFKPATVQEMGELPPDEDSDDTLSASTFFEFPNDQWRTGQQLIPQREIEALIREFPERGQYLRGTDPLVQVDCHIRGTTWNLAVVEQGKALILTPGADIKEDWAVRVTGHSPSKNMHYRFRAKKHLQRSQSAALRFLTDVIERPPVWGNQTVWQKQHCGCGSFEHSGDRSKKIAKPFAVSSGWERRGL